VSGEGRVRVVYRPSPAEEAVAAAATSLGALAYLAGVAGGGNPFQVITGVAIYGLLGYLAITIARETLAAPLVRTIARLKAEQARLIVKEACGREISEEEALQLVSRASQRVAARRRKGKGRRGGQTKPTAVGNG